MTFTKKMMTATAALALTAGAAFADAHAMNPMVGGAEMSVEKNIVENAVNSADHTTLVAAVQAAGLVETLSGEGQRIRPAPYPAGLWRGSVGRKEPRHPHHPLRRFGAHHARTPRRQRQRVLTDATSDVEHAATGIGAAEIEGHLGHAREEVVAVRRGPGRNHVAHVSVEVHYPHGGEH